MCTEWTTLAPDNLDAEHLCCIIRSKVRHPGVEAKRRWLADRLPEGHVFRKLNDKKATVFIEYAPLETAWVPIVGDNYLYIYCLWVTGGHKGKGYGRALMESCLADARAQGRSGVCMLGAKKQKAWLADQAFAKKYGFTPVDETDDGYELLALSFDGSQPRFAPSVKASAPQQGLTLYYDDQCPFIPQKVESIRTWCAYNAVPISIVHIDSLEKAKSLPCVFNNWALLLDGRLVSVNLMDASALPKLLKK